MIAKRAFSRYIPIVMLPLLWSCVSPAPARRGLDPGLVELCRHMSGSFSSQAQAERDPDFRDIRLHMVRLWPEEREAVWLYVEQAAATSLEQPYRQRVYRVAHLGGDLFESRVYEFPDPLRLAGAWKDRARLAQLDRAQFEDRQGCAILLRRLPDGSFAGSTLGRLCVSTHRGASYATSEVTITPTRLVSWDRGFDAAGKQVWGAEKGGYEFDKLESYPLE
ncbi:MAG TPA: chromophore lyase CpcT/CpeT [Thermoanaerobaculaceae bacterium]|nr:chromophore lyase CpcT/CpeT [Thermoanaerobaculaceae bacterium]HRS14791.1 chromophore lyase CpcT/CpeT [Thermoanaerobaculaceae bacterium]